MIAYLSSLAHGNPWGFTFCLIAAMTCLGALLFSGKPHGGPR